MKNKAVKETVKAAALRIAAKCPECSSTNLVHDYDSGETVCGGCGLVVERDQPSSEPEWRAYTLEEKLSRDRAGLPITFTVHDKGLSTEVGRKYEDRDSRNRKFPISTKEQVHRIRDAQNRFRVHSALERNITQALSELARLLDKLSIESEVVKEETARKYRKAVYDGFTRGRGIRGVIPAILYDTLRQYDIPRNLEEIAEVGNYNRKTIARNYRLWVRKYMDSARPPFDSELYLGKIFNKLMLNGVTQKYSLKILEAARKEMLTSGRSSEGVAAAVVYVASVLSGERKTQYELAEVMKVTEVTIRNRYKEIVENLLFTTEL